MTRTQLLIAAWVLIVLGLAYGTYRYVHARQCAASGNASCDCPQATGCNEP
jgi:hypothetical protein